MKQNRIMISGDFRADDTVNYRVTKTIFTGEGEGDYTMTVIEEGITKEMLWDDKTKDAPAIKYFKNRFAKEGFDFYCGIN